MAIVKPVASIGIQSTFFFPDPEALHAKDSWHVSLRATRNAPGGLCSINSMGKAPVGKKNLWQKIKYFLRQTFCASNRFAYVDRSTPRAAAFDLRAIKKSIPGDLVYFEAGNKIRKLERERHLLYSLYDHYVEAPTKRGDTLAQIDEIKQTNQSLLDDCITLKAALGDDHSRGLGLDVFIAGFRSLTTG